MAKWLYVQAQYGWQEVSGQDAIWFRSKLVDAETKEEAYDAGQRIYPTMDEDAELLNDYVVRLPA